MATKEQVDETQNATVEAGDDAGQDKVTEAKSQDEEKRIQAMIDRRVTEALKTQEARLMDEYNAKIEAEREAKERAKLESEGRFEELNSKTQAELDDLRSSIAERDFRLQASEWLQQEGLSLHTTAIMRGARSMEEVESNAKAFKDAVASAVEQGVRGALDTGPPRTPVNTKPTQSKTADQMTPEEFEVYKKARGLV